MAFTIYLNYKICGNLNDDKFPDKFVQEYWTPREML